MQQHNLSTLKSRISLVLRRFHISLGLYSLPNWYKLSLRRSSTLRISALLSSFILILIISAIIIPIYNKIEITEAATGTAKESSLSFNLTNSTASVDLSVNDANGTFASSSDDNSKVKFNISTTNYTGYTLSISSSNNSQTLVNESNNSYTLSSITSATSYDAFSDDTTAASSYNGKWGYLPSKINSSANTNYLPAPTATASTLDKTTTANSTTNSYTIGIGARASYTQPAGTYSGTYTLTAIGNTIAYYIGFSDNSGDSTVAYMPGSLYGSVSTTSVTLPSTIPTRTGYTFRAWCLGTVGNSGTTCSGTEYNANSGFGLDQTSFNGNNGSPIVLYATWTPHSNTVTLTRGSNITNITLGNSGATTASSASGNFDYASTVTMSATKTANTTCLSYSTPKWSVTSGGVTLSNTSGTSVSFTMPDNAVAVSVSSTASRYLYNITYDANGGTGTMDLTKATCGRSSTLRANTFTKTGYTFVGWSTSPSATTATYTDGQSVTLSRTSTLALYAVWELSTYNLVVTGDSNLSSMTLKQGSTSGTTINGTKSGNTITFSNLTYGISYYLYPVFTSGYEFSSYTKTDSVMGAILGSTSEVNTYYTIGEGNGTITVESKVSPPSMQTFTLADCQSLAGSSHYTVKDARDGNTYTVRLIAGVCWMTQNLRIAGGTTLTSTLSNVSSSYTIPTTDLTTGDSDTEGRVHDSGDTTYGYWYNYCAVTAGTICVASSNAEANYSICPAGWKLPTYSQIDDVKSYNTAFKPVYGGYYYNGTLTDASAEARWWSSSASSKSSRYLLRYTASLLNIIGGGRLGYYARCVRTS